MRRRQLILAVILTALTGCDNVSWGGVDVRMQIPPAPSEVGASTATEDVPETPLPPLPEGPILLSGTREGDQATLTVVGEVAGDAVRPLTGEDQAPGFRAHFTRSLLAPGTELVLFSEGVRVGRLVVTDSDVDDRFCEPRPRASGVVELVPGASNARNFLALSAAAGTTRPYGEFRILTHDYDQRVASIELATSAIPLVGASWPPSVLDARADIQVFRLPEASGPSVAATFLYGDRLAVARPAQGAWSLFVIGTAAGGAYRSSYVGYRPVETEGKGAPRFLGHLDWDGDGDSEILLEVLGSERRSFATLARRGDAWTQTFQDACGAPGG